jgi:hypothetical protein
MMPMPAVIDPRLAGVAMLGIVGGLVLLARGFGGYRTAARIGDIATSPISSIALGEVRVSGVVEAGEVELVSPIQSAPCVYYRSKITQSTRSNSDVLYQEERSVGFRVRDASGSLRVFPRGARWDVPAVFREGTGLMGDLPPGLSVRSGPAIRMPAHAEPTRLEREQMIQDLLTVHVPTTSGLPDDAGGLSIGLPTALGFGSVGVAGSGSREFEEARVATGDTVTIVGTVLRFADLPDPTGADEDSAIGAPLEATSRDPEIAADLAEARAAGLLAADPATAWGNAAIPGFGIGQPVTAPELDPAATPEALAPPETAAEIARTFDLRPDSLVVAADGGSRLLIAFGGPAIAEQRGERQFLVGLGGALLAIGCAVSLALILSGRL